jgi:hypothetical protein
MILPRNIRRGASHVVVNAQSVFIRCHHPAKRRAVRSIDEVNQLQESESRAPILKD